MYCPVHGTFDQFGGLFGPFGRWWWWWRRRRRQAPVLVLDCDADFEAAPARRAALRARLRDWLRDLPTAPPLTPL